MPLLYIVATPIGNLGDLTPRAEAALREADVIAAEDTRVTMRLLSHMGIRKPLVSYHRHNERNRAPELISRMLAEDLTVALASDAGTPAISDPGSAIVSAAWRAGIRVVPICGPSAATCALSAAGAESAEYAFYGFLPREAKALREKLSRIRRSGIPVAVLYESPHRIEGLLRALAAEFPRGTVTLCNDLTKRFERIYRGAPEEVAVELNTNPEASKGEYALVLDFSGDPGATDEAAPAASPEARILEWMLGGDEPREAAERIVGEGVARNAAYRARLRVERFLKGAAGAEEGEAGSK